MDGDAGGRRVAVLTGPLGANAPPDAGFVAGSLYVLDGRTGTVLGHHTFAPLRPHFQEVQFWQSVSVGPGGRSAAVGLYDGRTFRFDLETVAPTATHAFGAPVLISGVPVSAVATYTHLAPDGMAYFQTGDSSVPYAGAGRHVVTPPGPHPHANTIDAVDADGTVRWRYRSGHVYQNFWTSADGRWLLTCAMRNDERTGRDAGGMLFDTRRRGGGSAKLVYYYEVEGSTFFHADIARDGSAFAIVEMPYLDTEACRLIGSFQLHVVR
jgi:hypothetical protein